MPSRNLDQNLVSAQGGVVSEWGAAEGAARVDAMLNMEAKRGIDFELGIKALANVDASFEKFIAANLNADAHAEASLKAQIQLPLNLFKEAGMAIRLRAKAEAAAGVSLAIGIKVDDFLALVRQDPMMDGLPYGLLKIFLDEVILEAGLYAKAAFSAMAYANLVVTGTLVKLGEIKPGFNILAGFGAGLKAGAGVRFFARAGIAKPRRLVGRSIDLVVDETFDQMIPLLPEEPKETRWFVDSFRVPVKIALRSAFELGEYLTTNSLNSDFESAEEIASRTVSVILEECQRFILKLTLDYGLNHLYQYLELLAQNAEQHEQEKIRILKERISKALEDMPAILLENENNRDLWQSLINDIITIIGDIGGTENEEDWLRPLAILYSAFQLIFISMNRFMVLETSVSVIDNNPRQKHKSFEDEEIDYVPDKIKHYINNQLQRDENNKISAYDLAIFLTIETIIEPLLEAHPEVKTFVDKIGSYMPQQDTKEILKVLLTNGGNFLENDGQIDAEKTLKALLDGLHTFLTTLAEEELLPIIEEYIWNRSDLRLYFVESFIPAIKLADKAVFKQILNWADGELDQEKLKETMSTILMILFGRSLVVTTDILVAYVQGEIKGKFNELANDENLLDDISAVFPLPDSRDELREILADTLRIGGDVFGPLPDNTRKKIRTLLYDLFAPLPPDPENIMDVILSDNGIPNPTKLEALAKELMRIAMNNFITFVTNVLARAGEIILEELWEVVEDIEKEVEEWVDAVEQKLNELQKNIENLQDQIAQLSILTEKLFSEAITALNQLLNTLKNPKKFAQLRKDVAEELITSAESMLSTNDVYQYIIPARLKSNAKTLMKNTIRSSLDNAIMNSVWQAIGNIANEMDDLIEDIQGLDPSQGLISGISNLLLNRITDSITQTFGSTSPSIDIKFDIRWNIKIKVFGYTIKIKYKETIDLGHITLPLNELLTLVRNAISGVAFFEELVGELAGKIASAFEKEAEKTEKTIERAIKEEEKTLAEAKYKDTIPAERDIVILNPAPCAAYEGEPTIRIVLYGVPLSFLGLNADEMQRVFVWVNSQEIPLKRFDVEEVTAPPMQVAEGMKINLAYSGQNGDTGGNPPDQLVPAFDETPAPHRNSFAEINSQATGRPSNYYRSRFFDPKQVASGQMLRRAVFSPKNNDNKIHNSGNSRKPKPKNFHSTGIFATQGRYQQNNNVTLKGISLLNGPGRNTRGSDRPGNSSGSDEPFVFSEQVVLTKGRTLTNSETEAVRNILPWPYLELRYTIPRRHLEEGFNNLSVCIADGRTNKIIESVSFILHTPAQHPDKNDPRLPHWKPLRGKRPKAQKPENKLFMTPKKERDKRMDDFRKRLKKVNKKMSDAIVLKA